MDGICTYIEEFRRGLRRFNRIILSHPEQFTDDMGFEEDRILLKTKKFTQAPSNFPQNPVFNTLFSFCAIYLQF